MQPSPPKIPARGPGAERQLPSRASVRALCQKEGHAPPAHTSASGFLAGYLASSGICIRQSSREKQEATKAIFKEREREAHSHQRLIVSRENYVKTHECVLFFRTATQKSFTSPQINLEFLDLILLKQHSSLPTDTG